MSFTMVLVHELNWDSTQDVVLKGLIGVQNMTRDEEEYKDNGDFCTVLMLS